MKIIGITGGVGAGKSQVLSYLKEKYKARIIEADKVGHLVMEPGASCYEPVIALLGKEVVDPDGKINRSSVAGRVFLDDKLLKRLDQIIHPAVKAYIERELEQAAKDGTVFYIVEAALLLEEHYDAICDEVWYIYASEETRAKRLATSRGYSDEKIRNIFASQKKESEFREGCDFTLCNDGDFANTEMQIDKRMNVNEIM